MITIRGGEIRLPEPCVLAVGKFESIHLGHRALIANMIRLANGTGQNKLATALVVFEPHPYRVLFDTGYKPLLTSREREHLVKDLGVDYLLEYPFNRDFAALSAEDFCHKLFNELQARIVVVGEGYRFGNKRAGTVDTLQQTARLFDAQVHVVTPQRLGKDNGTVLLSTGGNNKPFQIEDRRTVPLSSSAIRALLSANKLAEAEKLLGYPFFVMTKAVPTGQSGYIANPQTISLCIAKDKFLPDDGVYTTRTIVDGRSFQGITTLGSKPLAGGDDIRTVETHLRDFDGSELYGKYVRTEFFDESDKGF